jgi:hypothetical protein
VISWSFSATNCATASQIPYRVERNSVNLFSIFWKFKCGDLYFL